MKKRVNNTCLIEVHYLVFIVAMVFGLVACDTIDEPVENTPPSIEVIGVPTIRITTDNLVPVETKTDYLKANYLVDGTQFNKRCKIRGRGNSTWLLPKKPYKLKFDEKVSLFGFPENKDYILLAEYYDSSMLRTAYMFETSQSVGLEYTPKYQYVDLVLNDEYMGLYILTETVEKAKHRIDISKDGYIIEKDNNYYNEPLYFTTDDLSMNYTFKYPDADDGDIIEGDENFEWIRNFMKGLEESMIAIENNPLSEEYMRYINIVSFAKWYIAAEVTATDDPNLFYVLPSKGEKLKMMPMWDAGWSMGLWPTGAWGTPPTEKMYDREIWRTTYPNKTYFRFLFNSPKFVEAVKKEWSQFKLRAPLLKEKMESIVKNIEEAQKTNSNKWGRIKIHIAHDTWEEDVLFLNEFLDNRIKWMDSQISKL